MKRYTETIPVALAVKLKEKEMPMEVWDSTIQGIPYIVIMEKSSFDWLDKELGNTPSEVEVRYSIPTFGACFDWLMKEDIYITIGRNILDPAHYHGEVFRFARFETLADGDTWHETAERAIEKALTLI